MKLRWGIVAVVLSGCVSHQVLQGDFLPPKSDSGLGSDLQKEWSEANVASIPPSYKRGPSDASNLDPCKKWFELSVKEWPLQELAKLRAIQFCGVNKVSEILRTTNIDLAVIPAPSGSWLKSEWILAKMHLAQLRNNRIEIASLLIDFSKQLTKKSEKEKNLLLALEQLKDLNATSDVSAQTDNREQIENVTTMVRNELYRIAPRLKPNPAVAQYLDVAIDLRSERKFKESLDYFDRIILDPNQKVESKIKAYKNKRMAQKAMQDVEGSLKSAQQMYELARNVYQKDPSDTSAKVYLDASLTYARARWTESQPTQAQIILDATARQLKGKISLMELFWVHGKISEEQGYPEKAKAMFAKGMEGRLEPSATLDRLMWSQAWLDYKMENYQAMVAHLESAEKMLRDPFEKNKFHYWKARAMLKLGWTEQANQTLRALIREEPLSFYTCLAYQLLNLPIEPLQAIPVDQEPSLAKVASAKDNAVFEWLVYVNEKDLAQTFLTQVELLKSASSEQKELSILKAYAHAGLYMPLFSRFGTLPTEVKQMVTQQHWNLLFPMPWSKQVSSSAEKNAIPIEFIYSIMRQESAFNPEARSSVDAMGLLQLMPSLAKHLASRDSSVGFEKELDLLIPEVNIKLGATELANLLKRRSGQYALAVASYNSSDKAINNWLQSRDRKDLIEFIEEIPYDETRTYIKLVFRNFIWYRRCLNVSQSVNFPTELLTWH